MVNRLCMILKIGAALFCALCLAAAVAADKKASDGQRFNRGLFWAVSKDGENIGHIFGTLHTNDKRVTQVPDQVLQALLSADTFCMETFPGVRYFNPHWGFKSIISDMMLPDNGRLVDLVGKPLYRKVEEHLLAIGLKKERIERLKPWVAMHSLSGIHHEQVAKPKAEKNQILDHFLFETAVKHSVELQQLETLEELMAAYYAFPMDAQVALLEDRVNTLEQIPASVDAMIKAYLDQDLEEMLALSLKFISPRSRKMGYDKVYLKHVLFIRNIVMAHYMLDSLYRKNAFVAIGALHLYGEQGVLRRLEKEYGYEVKPVKTG